MKMEPKMKKILLILLAIFTLLLSSCDLFNSGGGGDNNDGDTDPVGLELIQGGTFTMGDVWGGGISNEIPTHTVTLNDFYIGTKEITHTEYIEFLNSAGITYESYTNVYHNDNAIISIDGDLLSIAHNGSSFYFNAGAYSYAPTINCPMVNVSWYGALEYCNWLSEEEGYQKVYTISEADVIIDYTKDGYRLPTEAEWEYAARSGGQDDQKWSGTNIESELDSYAWYTSNSDSKTHEVGLKQANELGLYDMNGNVWEWCGDILTDYPDTAQNNPIGTGQKPYSPNTRGGSWRRSASECRNVKRSASMDFYRSFDLGFRIARNGN